ncbi:MAG: TIGR03618 family F420-dependent PPOX class oxidoreductase [Acidimicrobiia bacterium]|nr:TIGR03618 family F420-dependent PPOX class oxidoreductase [Acidimicrobiia bacterium]
MASNRRDLIKMTHEERVAFIDSQKSLQVATINADGTPHLTTLWFAVVEGDIVFETFTKSQKIKNLERDPRIACLVEDGEKYEQLRGVQLNGTVELHTDPDIVHGYAAQVMKRNNPEVPAELLDDAALAMAAKRTAVVVKADNVVSWDHRKLGGTY